MFLRRLITLSTSVKQLHHHISLNKEAQADIKWWIQNLPLLNVKSIIPEFMTITSLDLKPFTGASSTIGFGAIFNNSWIQSKWPPQFAHHSIDYKELFAILATSNTVSHGVENSRDSASYSLLIPTNRSNMELWIIQISRTYVSH